jgi:hypothetical protein
MAKDKHSNLFCVSVSDAEKNINFSPFHEHLFCNGINDAEKSFKILETRVVVIKLFSLQLTVGPNEQEIVTVRSSTRVQSLQTLSGLKHVQTQVI